MVDLALLADELTRDEGLRLKPYVDTVGCVTIGVGRNLTDDGISLEEAHTLLTNDMQAAVADCQRTFQWFAALDDVRQRALVNLCFNMGLTTLQTFTTFLRFMWAKAFGAAADDLLGTKWATEVGQRAVRIAAAIRTGIA